MNPPKQKAYLLIYRLLQLLKPEEKTEQNGIQCLDEKLGSLYHDQQRPSHETISVSTRTYAYDTKPMIHRRLSSRRSSFSSRLSSLSTLGIFTATNTRRSSAITIDSEGNELATSHDISARRFTYFGTYHVFLCLTILKIISSVF